MAYRLLVCGGRSFNERGLSWELSRWLANHPDLEIITGYDPDDERFQGADELAFKWAEACDVPVFPFAAPWRKRGRAAGPIRNQRMLDLGKPHAVLAAPGGIGTADMCRRAVKAGLPVTELVPSLNSGRV